MLDDDTVVALVTPLQANTHHVLLGADGQVLETTDLGRDLSSALPAFAKDGTVAVSDLQYGGAIFEWDKYGHALRAIPPPNADGFYLDSSITIDESDNLLVEAVFDASGQTYLWMLSSSGKTLWLRAVAASRLGPGNLANGYANVFIQRLPPASDSLVKYAIADGSSTEIFLNPGLSSYFYAPSIDAATGLLLFYDRFLFHQVSTLDPATGQLLRHVIPDCSPVSCDSDQPFSAALSVDGTLRTVGGELDPIVGAQIRVNAFAASNEPATAIRVDQPGLDGAWFPLDEGGQGFTLDYIASANTIFMPWFTYGLYADNDASGLAWYGLQGTVASGATKVDLVIAQTDPGAFNSGTVSGHAVGIAQLTFSDCDNGQLHYQFNADTNSGVEGLIGLTRLTPSTATCELADGTVAPAQNTNAPAQGFDARQSGSWFDPATSGQGLDLTIIPASNSSNGLVFAAWFAFDPAGNGDDPGNQHWFTLQGDLSAAAGGKVTLPIYRIIGGSLDNFPTSNYAEIGHATFTMLGCDSAQFDYQFDATEVAHAFAKLDGTMHLVKIGGCSQ
jgi:hypothetical protein